MTATTNVAELRAALQKRLDENESIGANAIKIEEGGVSVSAEAAAQYRKNLAEAQEIKGLIDAAEGTDALRKFLSEPADKSAATAADAAAAMKAIYKDMPKSLGEMFTESEEYKAYAAGGQGKESKAWQVGSVDLTRRLGFKDVYADMAGQLEGANLSGVQVDPIVPRAFRRTRVRDLFPVSRTNAGLIEFFRVLGFGTDRLDTSSAASVVPDRSGSDFGLKPQSSLTFEPASAPVRTIAHYELAHRNVLQDEPQLQSTINNELLYGLRIAEDDQILNGTGTGEDLTGILHTDGIQSYAQSSGPASDGKQDALRRAATKAILAYYEPTGIVIHPYDWEDIELAKGEDEHYTVSMNVTVGAEARLWRMAVVDTPAIAENTALVGAFGLGAQLYDRQDANIRVSEHHADLFVRNGVAILAEERLALAVKRPESFVKVTLSA